MGSLSAIRTRAVMLPDCAEIVATTDTTLVATATRPQAMATRRTDTPRV
jgi:hypothetical protein